MPSQNRLPRIVAMLCLGLSLALAGCGGGGGNPEPGSSSQIESVRQVVQAELPSAGSVPTDSTQPQGSTTTMPVSDAGVVAGLDSSSQIESVSQIASAAPSSADAVFTGMMQTQVSTTTLPVSGLSTGVGWVAPVLVNPKPAPATYTATYTGAARYINASTGNDANPGTLAMPWRSLAPVVTAKFAAGDALLLNCGQVWRGTLQVDTRNAPKGNLLIGGYGDCSPTRRPTIRASDLVSNTGWAVAPGMPAGVYVKAYTTGLGRLFNEGAPLIQARFPNYGGTGAEFAIIKSSPGLTAFVVSDADKAIFAAKDLVGATAYIKNVQWQTSKALVKAYDANSGLLTLDRPMQIDIRAGTGYILEGKPWMLDSPGEWYLDRTAGQLYLWAPGSVSPTTLTGLEASWRTFGVVGKWMAGLRIERLAVEQQDADGIELTETADATVTDVVVRHAQELGISALNARRIAITGSEVIGAGNTGIITRDSDQSRVMGNRVRQTGGFARAWVSDAGITVMGNGSLAEGNVVDQSALMGIRFANRVGTIVRNNTVVNFCVRMTDCAGIYSYTGGAISVLPTTYIAAARVENNFIMGGRSVQEGCGYSCANLALGIYLDQLSAGVTITNNTISDTEVGIGLLNASHNRLTGNTVRGTAFAGFRGTMTRTDGPVLQGNQLTGNSFFVNTPMALSTRGLPAEATPMYGHYWSHPTDAARLFSGSQPNVASQNVYVSTQIAGQVSFAMSTSSSTRVLKMVDWQVLAPSDGELRPLAYRRYVATTAANLLPNSGFNPNLTGTWSTYFAPAGAGGSFSMGSFAGCAPACGRFIGGSTADYLQSGLFTLNGTAGSNLYLLRFTARGGQGGGMQRAVLRRAVSPWEPFGASIASLALVNGEIAPVEQFFLAPASASNAVLELRGTVGGETFFSDTTVANVTAIEFANFSSLISHVVNTSSSDLSLPCSALRLSTCDAVDETGTRVVFPAVVPARKSRLILARDARWLQP